MPAAPIHAARHAFGWCVVSLALIAFAFPAAAQGGAYTAWAYRAQIEDINPDTPVVLEDFDASGIGDEFFHAPVELGPNGSFNFIATPEVVTSGGTPKLKAMANVVAYGIAAGRGVRATGQAMAGLSDTFTVTAAPDFSGGYLSFQWGVEGSIWANVISSDESPHLRFVGWELYQAASLSVSGPGLPKDTLAEYSLSYASKPVTPGMAVFEDYLDWGPLDGALLFEDDDRIEFREQAGGGTSHAIAVALQPGVPVALNFELRTGVNMGVFNVDNGEVFVADHGMDFSQTATLQGLQLLNADGSPYAGAWSVASAEGIGYTLLPVPEPGSFALWLAGLGLLGGVSARRRGRH